LQRWPARLEAAEFRACFSEAKDPRQHQEHTQHTLVYRVAIQRLAAVFGCRPTEAAILTLRRMSEPSRYARELLHRSRTGQMLLDHGFSEPDSMSAQEHRSAVPIPQREIVRLETVAEGLVDHHRRLEDWLDGVRTALAEAVRQGAVGIKTIAAYRSSLRLRRPSPRETREAYARLRQAPRTRQGRPRLEGEALCHPLVFVAAEECVRLGVPLQVHCGIGDLDEDLAEASPLGLRPLLVDDRYAGLRLVLLHCYPYHREAAYLCSVHPDVYMDLSLAVHLALTDGARAMREALGLCPWSKLLYATDASRLPEVYLVAAQLQREALATALGEVVERGILDLPEAVEAGRRVLSANARALYRL
jgi:predicted TIM-barrel fold metal-dependent hydrolase